MISERLGLRVATTSAKPTRWHLRPRRHSQDRSQMRSLGDIDVELTNEAARPCGFHDLASLGRIVVDRVAIGGQQVSVWRKHRCEWPGQMIVLEYDRASDPTIRFWSRPAVPQRSLLSAVGRPPALMREAFPHALLLSENPKERTAHPPNRCFPSRSRPSPVQASNGALTPVRHPCFLFLAQGKGRLAAPQFPAFQINIGLAAQGPRSPRPAARFGDPVLVEPVEAHCSASHHPVLGLRRPVMSHHDRDVEIAALLQNKGVNSLSRCLCGPHARLA